MDVFNLFQKQIMLALNCHAIATVQSFDSAKQTVRATINYKKTFFRKDSDGTYVPVQKDFPILIDCPVIVLRGGKSSLTFPVATGDTCLILFNDRDIDNWFSSGQNVPCATQRLHSFADGIALIGLSSKANALQNYDTARASLNNDKAKVAVGPELIEVSNDLYTLNGLLQELVTDVKNLVTQTALISVTAFNVPPTNAAAITAVAAQLTATAAKIGGLLQ